MPGQQAPDDIISTVWNDRDDVKRTLKVQFTRIAQLQASRDELRQMFKGTT